MKRSILNLLLFTITLTPAFAQDSSDYKKSECYKKYKADLKKKSDRYSKASKRYYNNRMSAAFSGNIIIAGIGNSLTHPKRDDYNMFEGEILKAADYNIEKNEYKPNGLAGIYTASLAKYPNSASYSKVVSFVQEGFSSERFCKGIMGKYGINRVERYVLKQFKAESKLAAASTAEASRLPAVINSEKVEGKS